jgi:hypothetical protein
MRAYPLVLAAIIAVGSEPHLTSPAFAHPGGLNSEGCHNNRKTGGYHCHRGSGSSPARLKSDGAPATEGSYRNCSETRAAGAAPVRAGDPGYGSHLDRDGDGIGCE